ncbi:MAG TPA: NADH-quinone oxidoreductase subunit C [Vicinamibacterales bacterium]|jgi:NADH-quinone oxidoreductase subunit C
MDAAAIVAALQDAVPDSAPEAAASADLHATVYVERDAVQAAARALRDRPELAFTFLAELTAVDYWPREPRFELIYVLVSIAHRHRVRMKVRVHGGDAHVATVTDVWPAASWLEREVWDMFGIAFDGHPDPRRLLMPEDWEGHPLRKDYPVQIRMKPGASEPIQMTAEEFRANVDKDRLSRS